MGGCVVRTDVALERNTPMKLLLHVWTAGPPVVITGAVVRSTRPGALGLGFKRIRATENRRLRAFIFNALGYEWSVTRHVDPTEASRPARSRSRSSSL